MRKYSVAIVGATGAVGEKMLNIVEERGFLARSVRLLASERSAGSELKFQDELILVERLDRNSFSGIDFALFSAGAEVSRKYAPLAAAEGAIVIDNSSAFRMEEDVPLVVPEVNPQDLQNHKGIIANPNCSTIQMVVVLKPLYDYSRIKRIVVSTYQSVSGTGWKATKELQRQARAILDSRPAGRPEVYPVQIAFNLIPHIDVFDDKGYTK
ncbi:aspartate-semialdehyde dehydrogenase, partial [Candidatus Hakubella thermalkaliphila]